MKDKKLKNFYSRCKNFIKNCKIKAKTNYDNSNCYVFNEMVFKKILLLYIQKEILKVFFFFELKMQLWDKDITGC